MNFYAENNHVGLTTGQITLSSGDAESDFVNLDAGKHPLKARPTVVVSPVGTLANVNVHAKVQFDTTAGQWQFKAYISAPPVADDDSSSIILNYSAISAWAN